MDTADRNAIEGLFARIADVETRSGPRDAEAEALIADELRRLPSAPYYLAQTVLVQEHALTVAERRIHDLEQELERRQRGDFLGGLFGGDRTPERNTGLERRTAGPWDRGNDNRSQGGGFLAGAAQTALGVTGGVLLGSAIGSMFGASGANAAEPAAEPQDGGGAEDSGDGGSGDFGGGGDFDFGGDF